MPPYATPVGKATTIIMSLRNSRQGDKTPPGPALQSSRPAERGSRVPASGGGGGTAAPAGMVFSQVFVMAPIRSQDAELVFDVTQAGHARVASSMSWASLDSSGGGGDGSGGGSHGGGGGGNNRSGASKRVGTCRVSLRELADQKEHELPLTVLKKASWELGGVVCWS